MNVTFATAADTPTPRLLARVVEQDKLPGDLPRAMAEGAAASRFTGKAGQVFDGFHEADGAVQRLALTGVGKTDGARIPALEKAGGALTAKYLVSGEKELALDAAGLNAEEVAAVLLGMRLRGWRFDQYRTKLRDEQKLSLIHI